jgi:glycosyltransferase involved in cell wall biosynthesis
MGNVVLEAMACGCPVVVPKAGGIPSLVSHGKTGLLYAPGQLASAVDLTRAVLSDEPLRRQLGRAARETVEGWSWENSVDRVRQIYLESIQGYRPALVRATRSQRLARAVTSTLVSAFRAGALVTRPGRPT